MNTARSMFRRDGAEFDRGLGFFDAIYGFAITLLIANVDLPPATAWSSIDSLLGTGFGDQLAGFVLSFIVIAVFWRRNTELVGRFQGLDGPTILANLVTAGLVVLLPFTTQAISDPEVNEYPLATALYAANVALAILSLVVLQEVARVRGLMPATTLRQRTAERVDSAAQALIFLVSIPVAFLVGADWGKLVWAALLIVAPLTGRWSDRLAREESTGE